MENTLVLKENLSTEGKVLLKFGIPNAIPTGDA